MPASRWRGRRDLPGPLAGDDAAVTHRIVTGGELQQPVEDEPAAPRAAPVEAEHKLIQVALQISFLDRALVEGHPRTPGRRSPGPSRTSALRSIRHLAARSGAGRHDGLFTLDYRQLRTAAAAR